MTFHLPSLLRPLALPALAAAALFASAPGVSAQNLINFTVTGAITTSDPNQNGRLIRDGVPSVYTTNKTFPGVNGSTATLYHFDQYVFTNQNNFATPVFISLSTTSTNVSNIPFSESYLTFFNPTDISQNYRGDSGSSPIGSSISYSISVPANTTFDVIVNEVTSGGGVPSYTLTVTSVPEPATWAMMAGGLGILLLQRRGRRRTTA